LGFDLKKWVFIENVSGCDTFLDQARLSAKRVEHANIAWNNLQRYMRVRSGIFYTFIWNSSYWWTKVHTTVTL
jgi:hypothetical protein